MYKHCRTIVFLNGKIEKMTDDFVKTMKTRWNTLIYSYKITSEPQLMNKINDIERSFYEHMKQEYRDLNEPFLEEIDMRPGFESFNMMIVIDDLHKEVVCSHDLARKFQSIRDVGIQFLFVTQSFKKNIKENLQYVVLFKILQNKITLRNFLCDLSLFENHTRGKHSSIEHIYNKLVQMSDEILTFKDDDTCYLYIKMPKRGCKKVCDIRTAISNPDRQVCFQEVD